MAFLGKLKEEAAMVEERDLDILSSEIFEAIKRLKNGKTAGIDSIPAEILNAEK